MDVGIYQQLQEPTRNATVTVTAASTIISEARNEQNPRKEICIRNVSSDATFIVTVTLGYSAAVANAGIVLRQYESVTLDVSGDMLPYQGVITAINAVAGNASLAIYER